MIRKFALSVFISVLLVGIVAFGITWCLSPWLSFWPTFGSVFLSVATGWFVLNSARERRMEIAVEEQLAKQEIFDERNITMVTCPCQQNTFPMQLFVNEVNEYVCDVCKNRFVINLTPEPILQTDPVNLEQTYTIFQQLQEQAQKEKREKELD